MLSRTNWLGKDPMSGASRNTEASSQAVRWFLAGMQGMQGMKKLRILGNDERR